MIRERIVYKLTSVRAVVVMMLVATFCYCTLINTETWMQAFVGILNLVIGYYFGHEDREAKKKRNETDG